jgi:16S rRNA (cytosine1402-N4)-methyltransferase
VSTFYHQPVLLKEVLAALQPKPHGRYIDGTVGGGNHTEAILQASSPTGWVYGFDRDAEAIGAAQQRLRNYEGRYELHRANYVEMGRWVQAGSCDGVLLDLGVSSYQLETASRGFSFQQDGPLDMRMDPEQSLTAAELVNEAEEAELARIFWEYGDEPQARRVAQALVMERSEKRLETTGQLARCVERLAPRHGKRRHPATRVFLALRVAVNDEVNSLKSGLAAAYSALAQGGRMAIITFHSAEDRIVKRFGQEYVHPYTLPGEVDLPELRVLCLPRLRWVSKKPILPSQEELAANPRARSAQLRVMEKTGH